MSRIAGTLAVARARVVDAVLHLPDAVTAPRLPSSVRYDPETVPPPVPAPHGQVRVLFAPANFSGQGALWARAVEHLDGVGAVSLRIGTNAFRHAVDHEVDARVAAMSWHWGNRQLRAAADGFTHVLVEAGRAPAGRARGGSMVRQVQYLRRRGVAVAMISHGSDLRSPSANASRERWSPFREATDPRVVALEASTERNRRAFTDLGGPVFVATPDLLLDAPGAVWLPNVVEPGRWENDAPVLSQDVVRVLHAPSSAWIKGTEFIEPVLLRLAEEGLVTPHVIADVPWSSMPGRLAESDVVVEQVRLGMYSTSALEAMAAGRLVVGHVSDQVRGAVLRATGWNVPIVEADPDTLDDVLRDVVDRRDHYRRIAADGPRFVREIHDGRVSATVLAPFLGREGRP